MKGSIAVIGAGFSGAVIANELSRAGYRVTVFESRSHVAGNCHTRRDEDSGVMLHVYGPHIFNTNNEEVWRYVQALDEFMPFVNRVKAFAQGRVFSLPINLLTINQFFGKQLGPAAAAEFITALGDASIAEPKTFEEQALRFVGRDLYQAFFRGYTIKQWGVSPSELPASILKRLPIRFSYDDNYYSSTFQGIPRHGYTHMVERLLDNQGIQVLLGATFDRSSRGEFDHVFYSGPLDAWFGHLEGRLGYRTLDFHLERHYGDYQGNAVINYCDAEVPWTRISEHKHFAPWESHRKTVIYKEHSRQCDEGDVPYYPIRLVGDKQRLQQYVDRANQDRGVTFVGRLGTYRYLDMDVTIHEALLTARRFVHSPPDMPAFVIDPMN